MEIHTMNIQRKYGTRRFLSHLITLWFYCSLSMQPHHLQKDFCILLGRHTQKMVTVFGELVLCICTTIYSWWTITTRELTWAEKYAHVQKFLFSSGERTEIVILGHEYETLEFIDLWVHLTDSYQWHRISPRSSCY